METKLNAIEQKYQEKGELVNFDELLNVVYEEIVKIPKENVKEGNKLARRFMGWDGTQSRSVPLRQE